VRAFDSAESLDHRSGRRRNGIGEHIGKYFHQHGATVTSVLEPLNNKPPSLFGTPEIWDRSPSYINFNEW